MDKTIVMVLAGGKGKRLAPLTCHRAKPAVPFGGRYRIIDFVLSNLINSEYRCIYVLTQYMASSLIRHLNRTWHLSGTGEFLEVVPAQMRRGDHWYRGTADSVLQNDNLIVDSGAKHIGIFGGDHVYKFDVRQMESFHRESNADVTIAAYPVPRADAHQFGVFEVDTDGRLLGFSEKPDKPETIPGRPDYSLVSMGNYFFKSEALLAALHEDDRLPEPSSDFGKGIIPRMLASGANVCIYDFSSNNIEGEPEGAESYWRDVGTLDSYFEANMDLRQPVPKANLYNFRWRIRTAQRNYPPLRMVSHPQSQTRHVIDSMLCEGTIVASSQLTRVVAGYDCFFHADSEVEDSVILSGCDIGARSRLRSVLLDKNCQIAPDAQIGMDPERDHERFPFITSRGLIVLPKGTFVPADGPIELSRDMAEVLMQDTETASVMKSFEDRYRVSTRDRRSHESVGPRFRRFGPDAVE